MMNETHEESQPQENVLATQNVFENILATQTIASAQTRTNISDDEISGLELKEYALKHNLSVEGVWRLIKKGQLIARSENGFLYVYGKNIPNQQYAEIDDDEVDLPPLPTTISEVDNSVELAVLPQFSILMEHLKSAKEEQRDIIKLTQDSVKKITDISDSLLQTKNELLAEREKKIEQYEQALQSLVQQNQKLNREKEDLEILAKALGDDGAI